MRFHRVSCLVASVALSAASACAQFAPDILLNKKGDFKFVAYGDIRFTDPANTQASNPPLRRALVQKIAREHPEVVTISGDLVLRGDDPQDWKRFDEETAPLRAVTTVLPALGNHDLALQPAEALPNYFQRFPELKNKRWYSVRRDNVVFLVVDSSVDAKGGDEWRWLEKNLDAVPGEVNFVFVALHHPPITHSNDATGHRVRASEQELAVLIESYAAKSAAKFLVLAGHVHNYERYEHGGVEYIVTGGGGATPYPVPRAPEDHYREEGPTYHYCRFTVRGKKLHMEMVKAEGNPAQPRFAVKDSFDLAAGGKAANARVP